jgi:hypothetical protein
MFINILYLSVYFNCDVHIEYCCEISSSHGGEFEVQIYLLGCTAV